VPVIVLASALDETRRDAYIADVAVRKAAEISRETAALAAAEAELAAAPTVDEGGGLLGGLFGSKDTAEVAETPVLSAKTEANTIACETDRNGVKRCSVEGGETVGN
jgi:hypothetical protein